MGEGVIDDATELFRCECREFLRLMAKSGVDAVDARIAKIEERRGTEAAERLRRTCSEQWRLGNRGEKGDWR